MDGKSDTYSIKAGIFFQMQELMEVSYLLSPSPKASLRSLPTRLDLEMTRSVVEWFLLNTWMSGGD